MDVIINQMKFEVLVVVNIKITANEVRWNIVGREAPYQWSLMSTLMVKMAGAI